jgi:6-phosphogluconate dehydrogenase
LISLKKDVAKLLKISMDHDLPATSMAASLNYFTAYTIARLPANLIQAQRDYFGAHTYERIDKAGVFHSQWENKPIVSVSAQKPKQD